MPLERLESIPDEVDALLFKSLARWRGEETLKNLDDACAMQNLLTEILADRPEPVMRVTEEGWVELSMFGVLNGLFMYMCPGYRLMVTEGPNEPRRLWVAKEVK